MLRQSWAAMGPGGRMAGSGDSRGNGASRYSIMSGAPFADSLVTLLATVAAAATRREFIS